MAKIAVDFTILTEIILEPDVPGVSLFFQILHCVPPPKVVGPVASILNARRELSRCTLAVSFSSPDNVLCCFQQRNGEQ